MLLKREAACALQQFLQLLQCLRSLPCVRQQANKSNETWAHCSLHAAKELDSVSNLHKVLSAALIKTLFEELVALTVRNSTEGFLPHNIDPSTAPARMNCNDLPKRSFILKMSERGACKIYIYMYNSLGTMHHQLSPLSHVHPA